MLDILIYKGFRARNASWDVAVAPGPAQANCGALVLLGLEAGTCPTGLGCKEDHEKKSRPDKPTFWLSWRQINSWEIARLRSAKYPNKPSKTLDKTLMESVLVVSYGASTNLKSQDPMSI